MNELLIVITLAAVGIAIAMSAIAIRLLRQERRRSAARVRALAQLAGDVADESPEDVRASADVDFELEADPAFEVAGVPDLFAGPLPSSPWRRRAPIIAGLAGVVLVAVLLLRPSASATNGTADAVTAAAASLQAKPLDLLSLRHTQDGPSLTITGLVRNPRGAAALTKLTATAFLFASDGTFLTSGRAPLDFTTLGPGDESSFVITVPVATSVTRYRVSFRDENGRVIAHVDRRTGASALARKE